MNVDKDIFEGESFKEPVHEEMEFYDMESFEGKIMKRLDVLDEKMDHLLEEVEDNNHRLKGIQFQFTRQLIIRVIKLGVIAYIIFYVYNNFVSPLIIGVSDKYFQINNTLDRLDAVNSNSENITDTVNSLFPDMGNVLDTLRPNTEGSGVEDLLGN